MKGRRRGFSLLRQARYAVLSALFFPLAAYAEATGDYYFIVWLNDGTTEAFNLNEQPKVEYSSGTFLLKGKTTDVMYNVSDVSKFTLTDDLSGIETGVAGIAKSKKQAMSLDANTVLISGGKANAATLVYTADGACVGRYNADADGSTIIPLTSLPDGLLIVKTETITYKITKR